MQQFSSQRLDGIALFIDNASLSSCGNCDINPRDSAEIIQDVNTLF